MKDISPNLSGILNAVIVFPVLPAVVPFPDVRVPLQGLYQLQDGLSLPFGIQIWKPHAEHLFSAVSVVPLESLVDGEEMERFPVVHQHGGRVVLEKLAV